MLQPENQLLVLCEVLARAKSWGLCHYREWEHRFVWGVQSSHPWPSIGLYTVEIYNEDANKWITNFKPQPIQLFFKKFFEKL